MQGHARAEHTSLVLHREVARRLRADPEWVTRARERVRAWGDEVHPSYRERWLALLSGPLDTLCDLLEADTEEARDLRQVSPFAGILDPETRWRLWRQARGR